MQRTKHISNHISPGKSRMSLSRDAGPRAHWGFSQAWPRPALMAPREDLRNGLGFLSCFMRNKKRTTPLPSWCLSIALAVGEWDTFQWIQPPFVPKSAAIVLKNTLQLQTGQCLKLKEQKALSSIMQLYLILPGFPNSGEKPIPVNKPTRIPSLETEIYYIPKDS